MHRYIYPLAFLLLSFSACTKDDKPRNASIIFTGDTYTGCPIIFDTGPSLHDISWHFGDGENSRSTESNPTHTYKKAGNYNVTVSGTKKGRKYGGQMFIYISDSATFIARKYGKDITHIHNWHHTGFSEPTNPGIPPTYTVGKDTSFAYKMANDSTLFPEATYTGKYGNVIHFSGSNYYPHRFSMSYNVVTGEVSFTKWLQALGGRSGETYTSF